MKSPQPYLCFKQCCTLLFTIGLCALAYSCRKDHTLTGEAPAVKDGSLVADARAWYQKNAPAPVTLSANTKLQTLSTPIKVDSWSRNLSPLWDSAYTFARDSFQVVEAPLSNATLYFLENQTSVAPATPQGKNYTKTQYVFTRSKAGSFSGYLMVIISDPAYANDPANHPEANSYKTRDARFSGKLLYYDLNGRLLKGYRYKDGQINGSVTPIAAPSADKRVEAIKPMLLPGGGGCQAQPITTSQTSCVTAGNGATYCTTYYYTTYVNVCDDGGGGGTGGGGGSGGGNGGGGGGSFPPAPPLPPTGPTGSDNPCGEKNKVRERTGNANVAKQNGELLTWAETSPYEYGTEQNLKSWPGNDYMYKTTRTTEQTNTYTSQFTWDATNGYTVGFSHDHPLGSAPSPGDVYTMVKSLQNANLQAAGADAIAYYKANVTMTAVTTDGTYVITIKNWAAMQNFASQYASNPQSFRDAYSAKTVQFDGSTEAAFLSMFGDASATFGDAVNLYKAEANSNDYQPKILNNNQVVNKPCND